jgi:pimeloyl-ACP methyl ester carboxylesterase
MDTAEEIQQLRMVTEISGLKPPDVVVPESGDMVVEQFRLHYLDWGNTKAAGTILFLHGGGLNAHTWDVVSLMLRGRYRCVALDQRGHGDSEWSPGSDYGMQSHLRDIEGFVSQMKLRRPVVVGQSMGGINAMNYAARHSDQMAGLVVVDVGPEIIAAGGERIRDFIAAPQLDSPEEFLKRASVQSAARPAHPAPQPALQPASTAQRQMDLEARHPPRRRVSNRRYGRGRRETRRGTVESGAADQMPDPGRTRRAERRYLR